MRIKQSSPEHESMDTFQLAVGGMIPNWNPWNISKEGFGFSIVIVIPEIPQNVSDSGGGWNNIHWETDNGYAITIRIKYHNKEWVQSKRISSLSIRSLERVVSSFRRITTKQHTKLVTNPALMQEA